jgi:protocatechuate 3,4-dioxygenase beta subunit
MTRNLDARADDRLPRRHPRSGRAGQAGRTGRAAGLLVTWAAGLCALATASPGVMAGLGATTVVAVAATGCKRQPPPAQAAVRGRVKSANGRALGDVKLRLMTPDKAVAAIRESVSAADGGFALDGVPAGRYLLRAEQKGFSPATVSVDLGPGETVNTVLRLDPMQLLEGRVEDRQGQPVAQAALFAWPLGDRQAGVVEIASGADGKFALAGLAAGPWTVMVEAPGFGTLRLERVDVPSRPLVLRLQGEARSLGGLVLEANGSAARDAKVILGGPALSQPMQTRANDKGIFLFHGLGFGHFVVRAMVGDKVSRSVAVVIDDATGWLPPVKLTLAPGAMLKGRVLDDLGRPLSGADVELTVSPVDEASELGRTDRDGAFSIGPVPPGRYDVWARFAGHGMLKPGEAVLRTEAVTTLDLRLARAGQIVGTVLDDSGRPLPGALVTAMAESATIQDLSVLAGALPLAAEAANLPAHVLAAKGQTRSAASDPGGRYVIPDLPPGKYQVMVAAETRLSVSKGPLRVEPGKTSEVGSVTLRAGIALRGRLLDDAGAPLPGARVDVRQTDVSGGAEFSGVAGEDGRFVVFLPEGHFSLVAASPRRAPAQKVGLVVQAGQPPEELELKLERADAVVEGVVRDPQGRPAARARVLAFPLRAVLPDAGAGNTPGPAGSNANMPPLAAVSADRTGRFKLTGVPRQPFLVEVRHTEWPTRTVVATPGQSLFIELPRPGGIEGEVRDRSSGVFVARYRLEALGPDGRPALDVRTQGAGFELRGLLPGRWRLRFSADGYAPSERLIEVPPGAVRNELSLRNVRIELQRAGDAPGNPIAPGNTTGRPGR